ncbi:MAG: efflux RND transporter periplasmic adaptor subunit, partial [Desulfohalobiaceae bacterium]
KNGLTMKKVLKILLPVLFLALGAAVAWQYISSKPTVSRQRPQAQEVPGVEVVSAHKEDVQTSVSAMGTVVPARQITLRSEVGGTVLETAEDFTPGGVLQQGSTVLRIDPRDYEIEVQKQESALAQARAEMRQEEGRQDVARQELDMLQQGSKPQLQETDLALRLPQLEKARAEVSSASSSLDKAKLDLFRTQVKAPFRALVLEQEAYQGSTVGTQDKLATLVDTREYHVRVKVPLESLKLLDLQSGQKRQVQISSQSGAGEWTGSTLRLTGEVDEQTRMATLLVRVQDPLGLDSQQEQLLLDEYVRARIQGQVLEDVFALPRKALRDQDRIWIYADGQLKIRQADVIWRDQERIYLRQGLQEGEQVIVSDLSTPVSGMELQVLDDKGDR